MGKSVIIIDSVLKTSMFSLAVKNHVSIKILDRTFFFTKAKRLESKKLLHKREKNLSSLLRESEDNSK